ncbi:hypothetical protein [Mesorhizobium sp. CO1-1-8]|uniref:hypothetical protein n=1 Tax=Mesorhizobium sp. CO1-1-8 TaxID=2876631 RepID=UPI001CD105F6|nr:hypothetical protein [Mesorhizobium sp. CO1-1-8]MBZ9772461.1 hypothetical protein [Mesorhizobium sp. CO1-1-8]
MYSVQQLLFDCMGYLKEFSAEKAVWQIGAIGPDNPAHDQNRSRYDVWLHRPALSPKAAQNVERRLVARFGLSPIEPKMPLGRYVFLGRLADKPPQ